MLGLDSGDSRLGPRMGVRAPASATRRFAFGGVGIELLIARDLAWPLQAEDERFTLPVGSTATVADVACAVSVDASLPGPVHPDGDILRGSALGGRIALEAAAARIDLVALGPRRYAASARVAPGARGLRALLRAVSAAILEREGGTTLHAAGVEVDGSAVVFLGPSGAGKSTAARLSERARSFADDHVALVPTDTGWMAWGLPGGSPARMAQSGGTVFPLAALWRVQRGTGAPTAERLTGAAALFAVRAAVECDGLPETEAARLSTAARIAREVEVGAMHTVLGRPLTAELTRGRSDAVVQHAATAGSPAA